MILDDFERFNLIEFKWIRIHSNGVVRIHFEWCRKGRARPAIPWWIRIHANGVVKEEEQANAVRLPSACCY